MARFMVGQRKAAPTAPDTPDTGNGAADDDEGAEQPGDPEMVKCPKCGCVFDGEQHETDEPASDYGDDKASPKGADLQIVSGPPDAQAPVGESAITQALQAVLGGRA